MLSSPVMGNWTPRVVSVGRSNTGEPARTTLSARAIPAESVAKRIVLVSIVLSAMWFYRQFPDGLNSAGRGATTGKLIYLRPRHFCLRAVRSKRTALALPRTWLGDL